MTRKEKAEALNQVGYDLNIAKDRMYKSVVNLTSAGMAKEADQLMKMIFKLEAFQNKYNSYSIYNK